LFPTRRAYGWLAVAVMAFAVYASLIPFELRHLPLDSAWTEFRATMTAPAFWRISRANFLANILLFVPVGFGLTGALLVDRPGRLAAIPAAFAVLPVSVAVSLTAEFLQVFVPARVPARSDVEAQTIGCLIGIAAWAATGPELTRWLRATQNQAREDRLARALAAYAAAWVFVNLAPFDITVDVGDLADRVRAGLITVVPLGGTDRPAARLVWDAVATSISAAPLGLLGLVGWTGRGTRRDARTAFAVGAVFIVLMEVAQIFVRSHAADITDILFGWFGVGAGIWVGVRTLSHRRSVIDAPDARLFRGWAVAALAVWCLVLVAYHWMPYDFGIDAVSINRKLSRISLIPFTEYASGSDLNAFNDLLVKLGLSAPFGVIAAFVLRRPVSLALLSTGWLAAAALLFGAIESGQFFLPTRSPDPTDVLVGIVGTGLGLALGRWLQADSRNPVKR
jgi:glycopeptide antibiotics resistance protein